VNCVCIVLPGKRHNLNKRRFQVQSTVAIALGLAPPSELEVCHGAIGHQDMAVRVDVHATSVAIARRLVLALLVLLVPLQGKAQKRGARHVHLSGQACKHAVENRPMQVIDDWPRRRLREIWRGVRQGREVKGGRQGKGTRERASASV